MVERTSADVCRDMACVFARMVDEPARCAISHKATPLRGRRGNGDGSLLLRGKSTGKVAFADRTECCDASHAQPQRTHGLLTADIGTHVVA